MIIRQGKCQFCQRVLNLEISEEYAKTRDPFKLIAKAACNRCADLRYRRRNLTEALTQIVSLYVMERKTSAARQRYSAALEQLTKKYCSMVADWCGGTNQWEVQIVEDILDNPQNLSGILGMTWKFIKGSKQPELVQHNEQPT